jgi:hypothetical protein
MSSGRVIVREDMISAFDRLDVFDKFFAFKHYLSSIMIIEMYVKTKQYVADGRTNPISISISEFDPSVTAYLHKNKLFRI